MELRPVHERRDDYLRRAEAADKQAATVTDSQARMAWQEIARSWQFLADQALRTSRP